VGERSSHGVRADLFKQLLRKFEDTHVQNGAMIGVWLGATREVTTAVQPLHIQEKDRTDLMLQQRLQVRNRPENEGDQDMVEYDLPLTLIALVVMAAVALLGPRVADLFAAITATLP
jgi:Flp pilus assembly pilin Flp